MKKNPIDPYILAENLKYKSARFALSEGKMISCMLSGLKHNATFENIIEMHRFGTKNLDDYFNKFHKKFGKKPSCKVGCSACCKYPIYTTRLEYEVIKDWANKNLSSDIKDRINTNLITWQEYFKNYINQWQGKEIPELFTVNKYKTFLNDDQYTAYTKENWKCPFLLNNICSIYDMRPISCRIYFNYGNYEDCISEDYPKGSISYDCARYNIYKVPLVNSFYKKDTVIYYTNSLDLLPLWFLNDC